MCLLIEVVSRIAEPLPYDIGSTAVNCAAT
jgi:hypothetical protein